MRTRLTDDEIVAALRELAAERGVNVTLDELCRELRCSPRRVSDGFGSWGELRVRAGLPEWVERGVKSRRHSRESLLKELKKAAWLIGPDVSAIEFTYRTGISATTVKRYFGTWTNFRRCGELEERPRRPAHNRLYSPNGLRDALRELVERVKRDVSREEFCRYLDISEAPIYSAWGSWKNLRLAAGMTERTSRRCRYTDEQLREQYRRAWDSLGRRPIGHEVERYGRASAQTVRRRLGEWGGEG